MIDEQHSTARAARRPTILRSIQTGLNLSVLADANDIEKCHDQPVHRDEPDLAALALPR